jgi:tetratricopeptide (TPR) repeat protein
MRTNAFVSIFLCALFSADADSQVKIEPRAAAERLGVVTFAVSCAAAVRPDFIRGVALLHDFWYQEAQQQFEQIAKLDPSCSMAHWGVAMSVFHQIWDRPDDGATGRGRSEMQKAGLHPAKTARERAYIAALSSFYRSAGVDYQRSIEAYSLAMGRLYAAYPDDVDAGAFYALSLLAAEAPTDTGLVQEHKAMAVLNPLFLKYPDHPGVVHYIIHACDTPSLAPDGLAAARHYGEIASSAPHAVHMPGHIFSRLGMWGADIDSNVASVEASHAAESRHQSGAMDQFHSDDFLLYAYLQTAQDARAKALLTDSAAVITHFETMHEMGEHYMDGMFPYYRTKFPIFFNLEMRDWAAAAALEPIPGAPPETQMFTCWARTVADGHLRRAQRARANLADYEVLVQTLKKGRHGYLAESTFAQIQKGEMLAWIAYAEGDLKGAEKAMRDSADLQDKTGQGEVDIPAREMLADILLDSGQPKPALVEYQRSLALSPNRFNGLFNAGKAAEATGNMADAKRYYAVLLAITDGGSHSARPEFAHAKAFQ